VALAPYFYCVVLYAPQNTQLTRCANRSPMGFSPLRYSHIIRRMSQWLSPLAPASLASLASSAGSPGASLPKSQPRALAAPQAASPASQARPGSQARPARQAPSPSLASSAAQAGFPAEPQQAPPRRQEGVQFVRSDWTRTTQEPLRPS
jgi:hypothetical protein